MTSGAGFVGFSIGPGRRADTLLDLELLAAPITVEQPAGRDARLHEGFDRIEECRRGEVADLPRGVWQAEPRRADWPAVEREAIAILTGWGKDLRVAVWLVEALLHHHGFAGLAAGVRLLARLCERYWPDLHPPIDDGDLDGRLAPIEWMVRKLAIEARALPILRGPAKRDLAFGDLVNAQRLEVVRQRDVKAAERSEAKGAVTAEQVERAAHGTPLPHLRESARGLAEARDAISDLGRVLSEIVAAEAPALIPLDDALAEIESYLSSLIELREPHPPASRTTDRVANAVPMPSLVPIPEERFAIGSRDEAYALLAEVTVYLGSTEPHSPVLYLLERALSWGTMPLDRLIAELARGRHRTPALFELLGLSETELHDNLPLGRVDVTQTVQVPTSE